MLKLAPQGNFIEMKVTGLTIDPFTSMPIIILKDLQEKRALPIWIGLIEASSIATELEQIKLTRPMTHDLMKQMLENLGAHVAYVAITQLADNTFYSSVVLHSEKGEILLDARPSDAVALSLRTKTSIYVAEEVIAKSRQIDAELHSPDKDKARKEKWAEILENLSPEDFGKYKM